MLINNFHRSHNCEAADAVAAAEVGEPFAGGGGDADLIDVQAHDAGDVASQFGEAGLELGFEGFDRDGYVCDLLIAERLEGLFKVDLAVGDAAFETECVRDVAEDEDVGEGGDGVRDGMKDDVAIGVGLKAGVIVKDEPSDHKGFGGVGGQEAMAVLSDPGAHHFVSHISPKLFN